MRPIVDDVEHRAIAALRHAVPEMEDSYLDLVDIYEDDVGADVVFGALADLVSDIVLGRAHDQTVLTRPGRPSPGPGSITSSTSERPTRTPCIARWRCATTSRTASAATAATPTS